MNLVLMCGEIHGHVHTKKVEKVKTTAAMRQKIKLRLSRCPVDGKLNASDAPAFAMISKIRLWTVCVCFDSVPFPYVRGCSIYIFI